MSDFVRPIPQPRRSNLHVLQVAISATKNDAATVTPSPPPGNTTNVIGVNSASNVVEINDANNKVEVGA